MKTRLKILKGKNTGRILELAGEFFIGRDDDNDLQISDETCSRHHAGIRKSGDFFVISDLGSNNGTFVNGRKISGDCLLNNGDSILAGNTLISFENEQTTAVQHRKTTLAKEPAPEKIRVESAVSAGDAVPFKPPENISGEDLKAIRQKLTMLYELSETLPSAASFPELSAKTLELVKNAIPFERGYVLAAYDKTGNFDCTAASAPDKEITLSRTILDKAFSEEKALLFGNPLTDEFLKRQKSVIRHKIGSVMCAPMIAHGNFFGLIYAECRPDKHVFTEDDLQFLNAAAHQAALAADSLRRYTTVSTEIAQLKKALYSNPDIIGKSKKFQAALQTADKAACTNAAVLILGETGTGKELAARFIHEQSPRKDKPFTAINCAALVDTLLESELFGHEKGAFTGASARQKGKFETADTGTVFLDEIGDMSMELQSKLLRVLQEKQFYPVGSNKSVGVDVRIVAATNRDLEKAVMEKTFREDLFYRISTISIQLPPLRERREDIPILAYHFLSKICAETKKNIRGFSQEALDILSAYKWHGNVRELRNVIERAAILSDTDIILPADLPPGLDARENEIKPAQKIMSIEEAEMTCILNALKHTGGKKGETAKLLGISWPTLNKKIQEYGIKPINN